MRLFSEQELADLSEYVNKPENELDDLTAAEADASNSFLRKNPKFYLSSHIIVHSPKYPKSVILNLSLKESSYDKKLEELFGYLQAPYRIYLGNYVLMGFLSNNF